MLFTILAETQGQGIWEGFWPMLWGIVGAVGLGLATWLTTFVVGLLNQKIKDKKLARWSSELFQIIMSAVQTVFQSFVDTMKKSGQWNEEAAKEAKERAYNIIVSQLSTELRDYITSNFGEMKEYLMNQIEAMIYNLKK